ncbi:alpha/beta hydrolase [Carboxylicivirga taeanensis]|uniref:alpha/beta hydrolase n=1 Tax=Carboxylicivirga taeanensis TaxID=1416875 RepID=UPI003F6DD558
MKNILIIFHFFYSIHIQASTVDTVIVFSNSMKKDIKNVVIIPDSYKNNGQPWPVLYGLHGHGGDYSSWVNHFPVYKEFADKYKIIIVFPDGQNSWYIDSPVDSTYKYETYLSKELIYFIDKRYNTIANRSGRIIFGASMGGHGAFYLAFRNSAVWSAAISLSGALDLRPIPKLNISENDFNISERIGNKDVYPENWELYSVINLIPELNTNENNLELFMSCGYDDFLYEMNNSFHKALLKNGISHVYMEMPGDHYSMEYWSNAIKYQFVFIKNHLKRYYRSTTRCHIV